MNSYRIIHMRKQQFPCLDDIKTTSMQKLHSIMQANWYLVKTHIDILWLCVYKQFSSQRNIILISFNHKHTHTHKDANLNTHHLGSQVASYSLPFPMPQEHSEDLPWNWWMSLQSLTNQLLQTEHSDQRNFCALNNTQNSRRGTQNSTKNSDLNCVVPIICRWTSSRHPKGHSTLKAVLGVGLWWTTLKTKSFGVRLHVWTPGSPMWDSLIFGFTVTLLGRASMRVS